MMLNGLVRAVTELHKSTSAGVCGVLDWNAFGVRDPSLLTDAEGRAVLDESGQLTLFFNARSAQVAEGGRTSVGVARGAPGSGWAVDSQPVFRDGNYAAQGSVLQLAPDHFRMYYSPDTLEGFSVASSVDGKHWTKLAGDLILSTSDFGIRRMGLPFVRRVGNGWTMLFEGLDHGSRFHIYQASSVDGLHWQPANDGRPVYQPVSTGAWDEYGQANPSLYVEGERCFILYNGCAVLHGWDIGILWADTLEGPWHGLTEPVLKRGVHGSWDGGRLEGARLVQAGGRPPEVVYFGLPGDDSYQGGRIAFASFDSKDSPGQDEMLAHNAKASKVFNDNLAQRYFGIWDTYPIQRFTTGIESRLMDDVIGQSAKVVLLGSGGGRELPVLLAKGCKVTAVDIAPGMLAAGRARYPDAGVEWVEADLHALPDDLIGYDAAVCLGAVFNYLHDLPRFLANVRRSLKPDGVLILDVINADHPSEKKKRVEWPDGRIRQLYALATIRNLLESAGFSVVSVCGMRFFADLLPDAWNRAAVQKEQAALMDAMLALEERLTQVLSAEQGKFLLVHAKAAGT